MVRRGRKSIEELEGPPVPDEVEYLWRWFSELERTRQMGHHGMQPLTYTELAAWAMLTDRRPLPYEVDALMTLDVVTRAAGLKDA